jgi:rRNA small subunit pseudouridine methyltransferase Nep1
LAGRVKIVLLESPLEIVPPEIRGHPEVVRAARRYGVDPGEMLLEKRLHYHAMSVLPQKWKRGRPDIVYITLTLLLDSIAAMEGLVELYLHVYDGRVFHVRSDLRPPRHYEGFKRIMAQMLIHERVPPRSNAEPLIRLEARSLREFVEKHGKLILLRESGEPATPDHVVEEAAKTGLPVGIGMFPRGDFKKSTIRKAARQYGLYHGKPLKSWTVAHLLLCSIEKNAAAKQLWQNNS